MITKVTIKGAKQAVQMFGPAQYAVAKAVADSVAAGVIPKDQAEKLCIVCGVFIHWDAADDKKIFQYNYEATKLSIARAMKNEPSAARWSPRRTPPSTRSRASKAATCRMTTPATNLASRLLRAAGVPLIGGSPCRR